jgi:hypothetical protein
MISDNDYMEFENFTKWLGVTQWLSGSNLRSLSSQKLCFCFLLSNVACYWYLQTWYLVLAFVVFYRWIFTSRYLWHLLWERSICKFQYAFVCGCIGYSNLHGQSCRIFVVRHTWLQCTLFPIIRCFGFSMYIALTVYLESVYLSVKQKLCT